MSRVRVGGPQTVQTHRVPRVWPPGAGVCTRHTCLLPRGSGPHPDQVPILPGSPCPFVGPGLALFSEHRCRILRIGSNSLLTLPGFPAETLLFPGQTDPDDLPMQVAVLKFRLYSSLDGSLFCPTSRLR